MIYCVYCNCDPEKDTLKEAVEKLLGCNNCRVDLHLLGDWTGNGTKALKDLVAKHGKEAVASEWGKHRGATP